MSNDAVNVTNNECEVMFNLIGNNDNHRKYWRFLKTKKLNGSNALNKSELRDQVKRNMRKIKNDKNRISTFFDEK